MYTNTELISLLNFIERVTYVYCKNLCDAHDISSLPERTTCIFEDKPMEEASRMDVAACS
jgi:hypothetical protein